MPSRPVLIGRGLVTHTHHKTHQRTTTTPRPHPESEPTNPPPTTPPSSGHPDKVTVAREQGYQLNNGSQRYGGHSGQETPGPIPNPEVKPASANGTAPDRMWESRTPPNNLFRKGHRLPGAPSDIFRRGRDRLLSTHTIPCALVHRRAHRSRLSSVPPPRLTDQEVTAMSTNETSCDEVNEVTLVGRLSQPA